MQAHSHSYCGCLNQELAKQLFKPMDARELQYPENVLPNWAKNLNRIVNKMNNTKSSMTDMKLKDSTKMCQAR